MSCIKPGDTVYYRGDWDNEDLPTLEDMADWQPMVVVSFKGKLRVISLRDDDATYEDPASSSYHEEWYFRTKTEALMEAAREEQKYGEKCLKLAERLRELAISMQGE